MSAQQLERLSVDNLYTVTGLNDSRGPWIERGSPGNTRRKPLLNWNEQRMPISRNAFETDEQYEASLVQQEAINALITVNFNNREDAAQHGDELIAAIRRQAGDMGVLDADLEKLEQVRAAMHQGHYEQLQGYAEELTGMIGAAGMKLWMVAQESEPPDSNEGLAGRYIGVTIVGNPDDVHLEPVVQVRGNTTQLGLLPAGYWPRPFPIYTD